MSAKAATPADVSAPPAKKGRKGLIIGLLAFLLIAGGAGGGAWMYLGKKADVADDEMAEEAAVAPKRVEPSFVPLDQFTVNLADEPGDRFIQVSMTLEIGNKEAAERVKTILPPVRNSILMLLSSKKATDVLSVSGKERLAAQVAELVGAHLGWHPPAATNGAAIETTPGAPQPRQARQRPNPVERVHFAHFIVQ